MVCYSRLVRMTWGHRITNETVKQKTRDVIGDDKLVLEATCRRKLQWFGHTTRRSCSLAYDGLLGGARGQEGQRELGSQTLQSGRRLGLQRVRERLRTGRSG